MTHSNPFSPYRGLYKVKSSAIESNIDAAREREATRWVSISTPDATCVEITEFALRKSLITHRLRTKEPLVSNQRPKLLLSSQFQVRTDGEIRLTDRYQSGKTDEALSEFQLKAMPNSELITLGILEENRRMKDFRRFFITFTMKKLSRGETFVLKFLPFLGRFL